MNRCPSWCAGGHRCAPDLGQHRSEPIRLPGPHGHLVATRARYRGEDRLEVLAVVRLPDDELLAQDLARLVLATVELAVDQALAGLVEPIRDAWYALTGRKVRG